MHLCVHTHAHILCLWTHNPKQGIILHRLVVEGLCRKLRWWKSGGCARMVEIIHIVSEINNKYLK